jgi:hypothetical protein
MHLGHVATHAGAKVFITIYRYDLVRGGDFEYEAAGELPLDHICKNNRT